MQNIFRRSTGPPGICVPLLEDFSIYRSLLFVVFSSSLLALSLDDFEIHIIDIDMRRAVRIFRGHTNRVTDMVSGLHWFNFPNCASTPLRHTFVIKSFILVSCLNTVGDLLLSESISKCIWFQGSFEKMTHGALIICKF